MWKGSNVKPKIIWMVLCRGWTPGFETILDEGLNQGLYDPRNALEKLVFIYLAISWLQAELDAFMKRLNSSPRHADKTKILPHRIPDLITAKPEKYNTRDFKILVPSELLDEFELRWAPPDHPIFQLTLPEFVALSRQLYDGLRQPAVSSDTFWGVYSALLHTFHQLPFLPNFAASVQTQMDRDPEDFVPLLLNLAELPAFSEDEGEEGEPDVQIFADFSDEENSG
ncbi:hypothetical protein SCP_1800820 [Sparassis crispa]|uniref:Uncharacterized protein n=1 Tax=Sparassis crispa TaxID=139825 RepID=A0A401H6S7_9APHY|nr:hypothetical protein SCP_1800820 [Sparassis crispa]GBE90060.1 hypothetical protein SCP_1800820 [Sparassis crispa]